MICQIRPRMRCSRPSTKSEAPMFTTERPRALDEEMTRLLFSVIWKALMGLGPVAGEEVETVVEGVRLCEEDFGLFKTRSSIVSGTASLISLERTSPSVWQSGKVSWILRA